MEESAVPFRFRNVSEEHSVQSDGCPISRAVYAREVEIVKSLCSPVIPVVKCFLPQTTALVAVEEQPLRAAYQQISELKTLVTPNCPFVNLPEPNRSGHGLTREKMAQCVWVKPERRCELEFVERTKGGRLRHALFRRLIS